MKNNVVKILLLIVMAALIAGCSAPADTATTVATAVSEVSESAEAAVSEPTEAEPAEEMAEAAVDEVITIEYWMPDCDTACWAPHEAWAAEYSELHPNVQFVHRGASWGDYWTKLPLELAAGTGPDMWWHHNAYNSLIGDGHVAPLPAEMVAELRTTHDNIDANMINGELYTFDQGNMTGLIFYNKAMWAEAGLTEDDIPTTWDEMVEVAKQLTVTNDSGEIERAGFLPEAVIWWALKYQTGEFNFTPDGSQVFINTEGGRTATQMMSDWINVDKIYSTNLPPSQEALGSDVAAMIYNWGWAAGWLNDNAPDLDWGVFPLPTIDGSAPAVDRMNGEATSVVSAHTSAEKQAIAYDFINWYTSDPEKMAEFALTGVAPVLKSIKDDADLQAVPVVSASIAQTERTMLLGSPPAYEDALNQEIIDAVLISGATSIEDGLKNAQARVQEAIDDSIAAGDLVLWGFQERAYPHADDMHQPELLP